MSTPMVKVPLEEMSTTPSFMLSGSFIRLWVGAILVCSISLPVSVRSTGAMAEPMKTKRNIPAKMITAPVARGLRKKRFTASLPGLSNRSSAKVSSLEPPKNILRSQRKGAGPFREEAFFSLIF